MSNILLHCYRCYECVNQAGVSPQHPASSVVLMPWADLIGALRSGQIGVTNDDMDRWIVAVTEPRGEGKAEAYVRKAGARTYLPMIRELTTEKGKKIWREGVFFPRYLFVYIQEHWRFLLSTIGIIDVIRSGGDDFPAAVPDGVIECLKSKEERGYIRLPSSPQYVRGQRVRVEQGCFSGMEGIYRCASSLERETVLLSLMGRETLVSVSTGSISSVT